jgi:dUTP pyrophosphatase
MNMIMNSEKNATPDFETFVGKFYEVCPYDRFMILHLLVDNSDSDNKELKQFYLRNAMNHNQKMMRSIDFIDAGFDLMLPYNHVKGNVIGFTECNVNRVNKLDFQVRCSAKMVLKEENVSYENSNKYNTGYHMVPRSSISKSSLRMANSIGVIDAGYRGPLIGMVDVVYETDSICLKPYDKFFQICAPGMVPILVNIVEELGAATERGEGGLGSTGR